MLDDDMYALLHQTSQAMYRPVTKQAINRSTAAARKQSPAENQEDLLIPEQHDNEESQWNKKRKGFGQKTFSES